MAEANKTLSPFFKLIGKFVALGGGLIAAFLSIVTIIDLIFISLPGIRCFILNSKHQIVSDEAIRVINMFEESKSNPGSGFPQLPIVKGKAGDEIRIPNTDQENSINNQGNFYNIQSKLPLKYKILEYLKLRSVFIFLIVVTYILLLSGILNKFGTYCANLVIHALNNISV